MPRQILLGTEARIEFENAVAWYQARQPGLGDRFETEVHAAFSRIVQDPERFRLVGSTIRKAKVSIFPYNIYFHVEPAFIGVVSVFNGKRDPAELLRRIR